MKSSKKVRVDVFSVAVNVKLNVSPPSPLVASMAPREDPITPTESVTVALILAVPAPLNNLITSNITS